MNLFKKKLYLFTYDRMSKDYRLIIAAKNEANAVKIFNKKMEYYGIITDTHNIRVKEYKGEC